MTVGPDIARIYGSIRTAHLERFAQTAPAVVIHHGHRYDYDDSAVAESDRPIQMTRAGTVWHLLRHRYRIVELNEPLVWRRWLDLTVQLLAIRLRSGRRTSIVAYCIGYSDPAAEIRARFGFVPPSLARGITQIAARLLTGRFDRLAFGTAGSQELYERLAGAGTVGVRARLFEALPSPCGCPEGDRIPEQVVFVGAFTDRKGIRELMAAWELVLAMRPDATLRLVGKGPLESEVLAWAASRPEVEVIIDPPRDEIHRILRRAAVLVLLSQPVGAWREQVGLPIVEGLAHGTEIVTTEQTGLAQWLGENGHVVVPSGSRAEVVADGLVKAMTSGRSPAAVTDQLPHQDQRIAADYWMTAPSAKSDANGDAARPLQPRRHRGVRR